MSHSIPGCTKLTWIEEAKWDRFQNLIRDVCYELEIDEVLNDVSSDYEHERFGLLGLPVKSQSWCITAVHYSLIGSLSVFDETADAPDLLVRRHYASKQLKEVRTHYGSSSWELRNFYRNDERDRKSTRLNSSH